MFHVENKVIAITGASSGIGDDTSSFTPSFFGRLIIFSIPFFCLVIFLYLELY
ncbi:MAG: hypothetical protein V7K40_32860 [Nostoc sp.]|uniref:hypothetical protein n=1 Tax=Nostoc sp. TaxID=1180 RepID=UPI002FF79169